MKTLAQTAAVNDGYYDVGIYTDGARFIPLLGDVDQGTFAPVLDQEITDLAHLNGDLFLPGASAAASFSDSSSAFAALYIDKLAAWTAEAD
jgi:hypothetical protein